MTTQRKRDAVEVLADGIKRCVNCHEPVARLSCTFCFPPRKP
jgi:hypothetical protein